VLSLANPLPAFAFNTLGSCHSKAICDRTPVSYTRLGSFWPRSFAFSALAGPSGSKTSHSGNNLPSSSANTHGPRLTPFDQLFWVLARKYWSRWKQALIVVSAETIPRWHRAGLRLYWAWLSHHPVSLGGKRIGKELRELIFRMVKENPT
jgi:hypothetical protein